MLTEERKARYSRNMLLPELGEEGQKKLLSAKVLVIGLGGLGSPVALYLAAAGVGHLGLVDDDTVDISNLQRQVIYTEADVGVAKVSAARKHLCQLNNDVQITEYKMFFTEANGDQIVSEYDFVIDATDSVATKFLINDICVRNKKTFCHGGVLEFVGQVMTVIPFETACYRCFQQKAPQGERARACSFGGVLGSMAGIIGSLQASEALKYITSCGDLLADSLFICDVSSNMYNTIEVSKKKECPVCGDAVIRALR